MGGFFGYPDWEPLPDTVVHPQPLETRESGVSVLRLCIEDAGPGVHW